MRRWEPLKLGQEFIKLLNAASTRQKIRSRLPKLRRGYARFLASDGSLHDVPKRYLTRAFDIDQHWCFRLGQQQTFTILDNAALRRFDRSLFRMWDMVLAANAGSPSRKPDSC